MEASQHREDGMLVKSRSFEIIKPSSPSPGGVLALSNNDQIMPRLYTSILFFFSTPAADDDFATSLKASLAQTLSLFYPCAGRYRELDNGELQVLCNDSGAFFHDVLVDAPLGVMFGPHFQPHADFPLLVPQVDVTAAISDVPIFLAQVTHFQCGGLCLGISLHHSVADGFSVAHFLSSWAGICREKSDANILQPTMDRGCLKAHDPPCPPFDHPEYQTFMPSLPTTWPTMSSRIFSFTPASIDALRLRLTNSEDIDPHYTAFEVIAAHLWCCVTQARRLDPLQEIRLGMAVNGRRRFVPPLPEGYFGNVNFYGFAVSTAGELRDKALPYATKLIHDAICKVTDAHMRSALDWVETQISPKSVVASFCRPFVDLAITSWSRFPLYDIDFGWGKPSFVRIPVSAFDGLIILLPSPLGAGHVDALIGFQVKNEEILEHLIYQM